jgi:hypothetical protein
MAVTRVQWKPGRGVAGFRAVEGFKFLRGFGVFGKHTSRGITWCAGEVRRMQVTGGHKVFVAHQGRGGGIVGIGECIEHTLNVRLFLGVGTSMSGVTPGDIGAMRRVRSSALAIS